MRLRVVAKCMVLLRSVAVCLTAADGDVRVLDASIDSTTQRLVKELYDDWGAGRVSGGDTQAVALGELTRHWLEHHATLRQAQRHLDILRDAVAKHSIVDNVQGRDDARRRLQHRRRCTSEDLVSRSEEVNSECCDEASEDCSSGEPATCNAGCASVLVPFFEDCRQTLEASQGYLTRFFLRLYCFCSRRKKCRITSFFHFESS